MSKKEKRIHLADMTRPILFNTALIETHSVII